MKSSLHPLSKPKFALVCGTLVLCASAFFFCGILAVLSGCARSSSQPIPLTRQYEVKFLFEVGNAAVYRFYDEGRYHYFASSGFVTTRVPSGKNSSRPDDVMTAP